MFSRQAFRGGRIYCLLLPCIAVLMTILVSLALTARSVEAASSHVDVMVLNSDIDQASLRYLTRAIDTADHDGAQALVIEIDTPGGDIDAMKTMTQEELASTVPIVAYVSPAGGRAASAGAFVTLAAQVAAMAPTTRIGASSPVTSSGGDIESTLKAKIENDLVAGITSFQTRYHRNIPLATAMITGAKSYDDSTAVQNDLVDLSATNLNGLLSQLQGKVITLQSGHTVTLQTDGAQIQTLDPSVVDALYAFLIDPNVVFMLFIVAMIGIFLEIVHPGAILPGVAGSISLLLFLFAAGSLTPNWAGLALMVLAFVLLVLDARLPTHGVLTLGAILSLLIGAFLFFGSNTSYGGPQLNPVVVYTLAAVVGILGFTLVTVIVRTRRNPIRSGVEAMIGARGVALTPLLPEGRVRYGGEDWAAILDTPYMSLDAGAEVQIVAVEGLRMRVQPFHALAGHENHSNSSLE